MLPKTDLSEYFNTRELAEGWYLLSNADITILVDTIKTRIYRIFAHGSFGTLQQLLYDTNGYEQSEGNWGIVPYFYIGSEKFYPFYHNLDFFKFDSPAREIGFFPEEKRMELRGITYASEGFPGSKALVTGGNMEICLDGKNLYIRIRYPETAHRTGIHNSLYPLYNMMKSGDRESHIEYQYGLEILGPKDIELTDIKGRMPGLRIKSKNQVLNMKAGKDMNRGEAYRLYADFEGWTVEDEISIEFVNNPVSVEVNPIVDAGELSDIRIYSKDNPELAADGKTVKPVKVEQDVYACSIAFSEGKHLIAVQTESGMAEREIRAVRDWREEVVKVGRAIKNAQWDTGLIKGLFPHAIDVRDGKPYRDGRKIGNEREKEFCVSYSEYGPREVHILVAASVLTGDRACLDSAKKGLETLRELSFLRDDGRRVAITEMLADGIPDRESAVNLRPASFGIIIGALLSCVKGYRYFKDSRNAEECLDWACEYAKTLMVMQEENGCFFERFVYPDLKVYSKNVYGATVCAWPIWIWELADEIKSRYPLLSRSLADMCRKAVDFLLELRPSLLRVAGTEGGHINSMESLFPAAVLCLIKFLCDGDKRYRKYAEDLYMKGVLSNSMYIDQPQNFMFPCCWWHSIYFCEKGGYPPGLMGKGGMFDLTMAESSIAMLKHLDFKFAGEVMSYVFGCRLATSIFENGVVCVHEISLPNFYYKNEIVSEDCEYGGLGLFGLYLGLDGKQESEKAHGHIP